MDIAHSADLEGNSSFLSPWGNTDIQVQLPNTVFVKAHPQPFKNQYLQTVLQQDIPCPIQVLGPSPHSPEITSFASGPKTWQGQAWHHSSLQFSLKAGMGVFQVNHLSLFQLSFLEHSWYSARRVTRLKGEKWLFLTPLLTALFYWLDRIKYKNRGVWIPIHSLCSEQIPPCRPVPSSLSPNYQFPWNGDSLNRNYVLKASEVLSLYTAL